MKRAIIFLLATVAITTLIGILFGVIVCAPEPWQTRPWTIWERSAQVLLPVLAWPISVMYELLTRRSLEIPKNIAAPLHIFLFILSGAFWALVIDIAWNRIKKK